MLRTVLELRSDVSNGGGAEDLVAIVTAVAVAGKGHGEVCWLWGRVTRDIVVLDCAEQLVGRGSVGFGHCEGAPGGVWLWVGQNGASGLRKTARKC